MAKRSPDVVKISTPGDMACAIAAMLGFEPAESVVTICTHGRRDRFGLVLRFDLEWAQDIKWFASMVEVRARHEDADGVFIVVFTDTVPVDGVLPCRDLADEMANRLRDVVLDVVLVAGGRWWSYLCKDSLCCGPAGTPVDDQTAGATALAAAYALAGRGVLPDRDAVVQSVAYDGQDTPAMCERIEAALVRHAEQSQPTRRQAIRVLVERLLADLDDPRRSVTDDDAAEVAALCHDVIVRDEVMVRAIEPERRRLLLRLLREVARLIPPPYDAPICGTFAWVAYADGAGVVANVAVDRALSSDPDYSLALLIADSLQRQVPPAALEEVMREAARDLQGRSAAG